MLEIIKRLILEFHETAPFELIKRDIEIPDLKTLRKSVVITGPRRSGKTFLLYQIMQEKEKQGIPKNCFVYLNFDDIRIKNTNVKEFSQLPEIYAELYEHKPIFFFDEIQNVSDWENLVITLLNRQYEVYVTGSNAKLLSKEIATQLRGKALELRVYPFSFREYLTARKVSLEKNWMYGKQALTVKRIFTDYLEHGGFPEITLNPGLSKTLLQSYIDQVLYKDVMERYGLRNGRMIELFVRYILNNMALPFTIRAFYRYMKSSGFSISTSSIHNLTKIISDSYLAFFIEKYDVSYKIMQANPKKVYIVDNSYIALSTKEENKGKLLENAVYMHLQRGHSEIYYYQRKHECDFIVRNNGKTILAIQVCYTLNAENEEREINGLADAMAVYKLKEGLIITFDIEKTLDKDGKKIRVVPAWKWMLDTCMF